MTTPAKPTSRAPSFPGFDVPRQNYFKMPNNWTDITAEIGSIAELKVVEYVLKHTWGYQEYGIGKRISLTEFMHGRRRSDGSRMDAGTGLSKPSVIAGLKAAIERGLLLEETDDSDKARIKKFYRLRMVEDGAGNAIPESNEAGLEEDRVPEETGVKHLNAEVKVLYRGVQTLYPRGKSSLPRTEKDTLEKHPEEKENNNNRARTPKSVTTNDETAVVVAYLVEKGIGEAVAQDLASHYEGAYIREKIEYLDFQVATRPTDVKKPAAWLRSAIERDFGAPDGFVSASERAERTRAENERLQALTAAQKRHLAREQRLQKEREAKREAARSTLKDQYAPDPKDEALWRELIQDVQTAGDHALYGLLAHTMLLENQNQTLTVAVPAGIHATQLESARMEAHLKRVLKRMTNTEYTLRFMPVDGLA